MRELVLTRLNQFILPVTHLLGLLLNLVLLFVFYYYHDHGFDLTDEAFYALSATQSDNVLVGLSFGYLTSYLMSIFSCDFHDTRIIGFILLLGSTVLMTGSCLNKYTGKFSLNKLLTAVTVSTPCIIFYSYGIYSLSYNSYAVFGINFILAGLFLNKNPQIISLPSLFVGLGIFLLGMSKFTIIPVFISVVMLVYFFYKDKNDLKLLLNGAIISIFFVLLHFFISDDSIELFINRLLFTYENINLLKSSQIEQFSLFFVISNLKDYILQLDKSLLITYSICPIYLLICLYNKNEKIHFISSTIAVSLISFPIIKSLNRWVWYIDHLFIFYFTQFILICLFIKLTNNNLKKFTKLLYLLLAPFMYAIGSDSGLSFGGYQTLFWPITAILVVYLCCNDFKPIMFSIQLSCTVLLAIISAFHGFKHPYRVDGRISQQVSNITTFDGEHEIVVAPKLGKFSTQLQRVGKKHDWRSGLPLIELTNSPGLTFLLSGKFISTPWLFAGYSGSEQSSKKMLELQEHDELKFAWVLTSAEKRLSVTTNILNAFGLNFPSNYNEIKIGKYNGNHYSLWKPST